MFPWGVDSILVSIEPGAAPRFVEGVRALESGLYLEAVDRFDRALSLDPDFTLAAIGLLQAGSLVGDEGMSAADHAAGRAWELRERLSERDRDLVATFLGIGPNYPAPSTRTEYLAFADTVIFSYLEEGRIAAATGDTKSAIWAYHRYLTLRASPDPEQKPDVEEVWAQLLRLYPEPGTR